jgi:hypothetical protein
VKSITVGHVEVDDLWVEIPSEGSMTVAEVISRSGMSPRDGSTVRCFLTNGDAVSDGRVMPGETVIIGSRPPTSANDMTLHDNVLIRWEQDIASLQKMTGKKQRAIRRFNGSGWIEGQCTLWVPGVVQGSQIRAVEISREKNRNGWSHAKGYRVRSDEEPYQGGDLVLVSTNGDSSLRIFDPTTGSPSIDVKIGQSSLDATFRSEMTLGPRHIWVLKISSFNSSERTALATVERGYTWWRKNS